MISARALLIAWLGVAAGAAQTPLQFTDVTATAGIAWQQSDPGLLMGAGGAWLDCDADGWQDLLLVGGNSAPGMFRNEHDGTFADISADARIAAPAPSEAHMGVAAGDYDDDGDPDIYLCVQGANVLYRNNGDGTFTDVTQAAGVAGAEWTTGAAFGDYDGDGLLDLYVGNYVKVISFPYHTPWPNRLYHNNGDGTFTDVTATTGVAGAGTTLAVSWSDQDGDGDLDLWVGNDFGAWIEPNRLYRNDGPLPGGAPGSWAFTEVAAQLGADAAIYCMGITAGDIDRDLDFDYYFSNLGRNVLLRNDGAAGYTDITSDSGTANTFDVTVDQPVLFATSWGVGFHDFDLDGWVDLYVSNGHIPAASFIANGLATPSALFHHTGEDSVFREVAQPAGIDDTGIGRGAFFADYDRDGDVDILQANINGRPTLFRNDSRRRGHWFRLRAVGRQSGTEARGARVQVDASGASTIREVSRNYSFESSSEIAVHVGLGHEPHVDRLAVRWPSGVTTELFDLAGDTAYTVVEPVVTISPATGGPATLVAGTTADFTLEMRNHSARSATALYRYRITSAGLAPIAGPVGGRMIPAGSAVQIPLRLNVPSGAAGNEPLPLALVWTVADAGGGVVERKLDLVLR